MQVKYRELPAISFVDGEDLAEFKRYDWTKNHKDGGFDVVGSWGCAWWDADALQRQRGVLGMRGVAILV